MKFKIGDKIRCVNARHTQESGGLIIDGIYYVDSMYKHFIYVSTIHNDSDTVITNKKTGCPAFFDPERFELVEKEKKLKWLI